MQCIIVDDEPLAREGLADYVNKVDFLRLAATAESPLEVLPLLQSCTDCLLLLDIQMPEINGLDFLRTLTHPPLTVITTAYPSFALDGYELEVLDYLVKPITFQRFLKAALKAQRQWQLLQRSSPQSLANDSVFIKSEGKVEKIGLDELLFIESMENYALLYTEKTRHTALLAMKNLEQQLPSPPFFRTHRSYIVNLQQVQALEGQLLHIGEHRVPVSRQRMDAVRRALLEGRLLE